MAEMHKEITEIRSEYATLRADNAGLCNELAELHAQMQIEMTEVRSENAALRNELTELRRTMQGLNAGGACGNRHAVAMESVAHAILVEPPVVPLPARSPIPSPNPRMPHHLRSPPSHLVTPVRMHSLWE